MFARARAILTALVSESRYRFTGRLIVRRVLDANTQDPLFPVWRYHPFFTNTTEPVDQADITHRRHAICETVWSDLIDGPWAHQPSGSFAANAAWCILAAICHNLLRAAGTLTAIARYAIARGATLRDHLINIPARLARPQRRPVLHLPTQCPRARRSGLMEVQRHDGRAHGNGSGGPGDLCEWTQILELPARQPDRGVPQTLHLGGLLDTRLRNGERHTDRAQI